MASKLVQCTAVKNLADLHQIFPAGKIGAGKIGAKTLYLFLAVSTTPKNN